MRDAPQFVAHEQPRTDRSEAYNHDQTCESDDTRAQPVTGQHAKKAVPSGDGVSEQRVRQVEKWMQRRKG